MIVQRPFVDPGRPAASFDRAFAQLTRDLFAPARRTPVVDAGWTDGTLVLTVDLPGTPAEAVGVEVADGTLTISVRSAEFGDQPWQRSIRLGSSLDAEKAAARYVDGRLTVTVPESAAPAARALSIDTTPAPQAATPAAAEATSTEESTSEPTPES